MAKKEGNNWVITLFKVIGAVFGALVSILFFVIVVFFWQQ